MEKKIEDMGEVQLYFVDDSTIDSVKALFPNTVAEAIRKQQAFGLAIEEESEIRGALAATFLPEDDRLEILSLYVAEGARRRRLGATLLLQTVDTIMEETEGELKIVTMSFPERITGIRELLEQIGFTIERQAHEGSFFLNKSLLENSILNREENRKQGLPARVTGYEALTESEIKELYRRLETEGIAYLNLAELKEARKDLSFVKKDASGRFLACSIITGEENLVLSQFYSKGGNPGYGVEVLAASLKTLMESTTGWELEVPCVSLSAIKLLQKLVPGAEKQNYIRAWLRV